MEINTEAIQKQLKKSVFGQDELIKSLAVIAWTHETNKERRLTGLEAISNRTLLIGPSGCGKTYAVKKLADILGTQFVEIDCSTLQGNNYTGMKHAYDMFDTAIEQYGKDAVENGIIFLDEFDKSLDVYSFKRYGSRHVQRDLLKIFEGETVVSKNFGEIDTRYMTIICAGSFYEGAQASDYYDNPKVTKMGFGQDKIIKQDGHTKFNFTIDDLISMGHLPELMGRFTRIVNMNLLDEKDIFNILKNGDSQIKIYTQQLADMDIKLEYDDSYYEYLAKNVLISKTGFRDVAKLISDDIDDIIVHLGSDQSLFKVTVDCKNNAINIKFFNDNGKLIDKVVKPIIKKKNKIKPHHGFNPAFDMD